MIFKKISVCTVAMNRLHHIQKTLLQNIQDNLDYPNAEFVLLDYNSTDGLEEWVKETLSEYINKGLLKYIKTTQPAFFDRSHSRNVVFKLASGEVVVNVDADNYCGKGFLTYINEAFLSDQPLFLVADTHKRFYFLRNAFGRFAVKKETLLAMGGLDEKMKSYGSETTDLYERLKLSGHEEVVIQNTSFLRSISHGDEERISNEYFLKNLNKFLLRQISYDLSEVIILYQDYTFENFFIVPNKIHTHLPASLLQDSFMTGKWKESEEALLLVSSDKTARLVHSDKEYRNEEHAIFQWITHEPFLQNVAKNYAFILNTETKQANASKSSFKVNNGQFGKCTVTQNFTELIVLN